MARKSKPEQKRYWIGWKTTVSAFLCVFCAVIVVYFRPKSIATQTDLARVPLTDEFDENLFWGTYRPHLFFGLSHFPSPNKQTPSLSIDLAWFDQKVAAGQGRLDLKYKSNSKVDHFGYEAHDGRRIAIQTIKDSPHVLIQTEFAKKSKSAWSAYIKANTLNQSIALPSFVWIIGNGGIQSFSKGKLKGHTDHLGDYCLTFSSPNSKTSYFTTSANLQLSPENELIRNLRNTRGLFEFRNVFDRSHKHFVLITTCTTFPCEIRLDFNEATQRTYSLNEFRAKIQKAYPSTDYQDLVARAISDLFGGIGHFSGSMIVSGGDKPSLYGPFDLLTASPCRTKFPRGFLWDEAFHSFVISESDPKLAALILSNYLNLMNINGWIPRELIIGQESAILVPPEYIVQYSTHANPPVMMGAALNLMRKSKLSAQWKANAMARMKKWYFFLKQTQGNSDGSYRWRGRRRMIDNFREALNPTTLPSGLDDYPRSSHLSHERHLDIYSWITYAARILSSFSDDQNEKRYFKREFEDHVARLDKFHWTGEMYADFGLHTENVWLNTYPIWDPSTNSERIACNRSSDQPSPQFIDQHFGYLSLFPLMLQIIPPENLESRLKANLDGIEQWDLMSDFGLRSLSPKSSLYQTRNTPDDPPYWRGAIWPHMNYLLLRALKLYSLKPNNLSQELNNRVVKVYDRLRRNLLENLNNQFNQTGFLYEQYDDRTGKGEFGKPFTGWTALVSLIASERYHQE